MNFLFREDFVDKGVFFMLSELRVVFLFDLFLFNDIEFVFEGVFGLFCRFWIILVIFCILSFDMIFFFG